MPVSVAETLASLELARRSDGPRPQDPVQTSVPADRAAHAHTHAVYAAPGDAASVAAGAARGAASDLAPEGASRSREIDGPGGPEPTRYGDWERRGRCIDF